MSGQQIDPYFVALYETAMRQHGARVMPITFTVFQLISLVSMIQQGVKHPNSPGGPVEKLARSFVDTVSTDLSQRFDPVFGELIQMGWRGGFSG